MIDLDLLRLQLEDPAAAPRSLFWVAGELANTGPLFPLDDKRAAYIQWRDRYLVLIHAEAWTEAAIHLVERLLPGWSLMLVHHPLINGGTAVKLCAPDGAEWRHAAGGATPARAILTALVSALYASAPGVEEAIRNG